MNNGNGCHLSSFGGTLSKATWLHGNLKYFGGDLVLLSRNQIFGKIWEIFLGDVPSCQAIKKFHSTFEILYTTLQVNALKCFILGDSFSPQVSRPFMNVLKTLHSN